MSSHYFRASAVRRALVSTAFALLATGGIAIPATSHAAAPMAGTQAPGYFRMMLGAFEVTALSDGTLDLPVDTLLSADAQKTRADIAKLHLEVPLETSFNAYLINTGKELVLIDTGGGALFGSRLGQLVRHIEAAGYTTSQIDDVLLTHLHSDHIGGLMSDGQLAFPNATVRADQRESGYWLSTEARKAAPASDLEFFDAATALLTPYINAGKYQPFSAGAQIVPGISAASAYGHTAGSTVYQVESQGKRLLLIGDLIHVGPVQFSRPDVTIVFDVERNAARASRLAVFQRAAASGDLLGGSHLPFPGLGRLQAAGKGFQWMPLDYTTRVK
ncbi:MBL fold metallo-hydrolase [Janthinobacterium lividum]|uniref:MBL fold metallo-hydrolase n=1 Tax=Janthinobacterium lividum TaxID=29581 RepID=UPI003211E42A